MTNLEQHEAITFYFTCTNIQHARLEVGAGRGAETLKAAGDAVFETMKSHFARRYESQGLALSLEVVEFGESGTWKHNNLHARFKDKA